MPATTHHLGRCGAGNHENPVRAPERVATRLNKYGYSRMYVHNASHMHIQFVVTDGSQSPPQYDEIGDDFWLVQSKHGPFAAVAATK